MPVWVAKTAGFCFGVHRAVDLAYQMAGETRKVCTLGPIIHNTFVTQDLARKGVRVVKTVCEIEPGETVIIRSHGVAQRVFDELKARGISYVDATCPFVSKIHRIVREESMKGRPVSYTHLDVYKRQQLVKAVTQPSG